MEDEHQGLRCSYTTLYSYGQNACESSFVRYLVEAALGEAPHVEVWNISMPDRHGYGEISCPVGPIDGYMGAEAGQTKQRTEFPACRNGVQ